MNSRASDAASGLRPRGAARAALNSQTHPTPVVAHAVAGKAAAGKALAGTAVANTTPGSGAPGRKHPRSKKKLRGGVANIVVMSIAAGMIATFALPAYAFSPSGTDQAKFASSVIDGMKKAQPQSVTVAGTAAVPVVARDAVTATSEADLAAAKAAAAAEAARAAAAASMATYAASYSGPSVSDFLANPPYPNFSLSQVFSVAQQYIGTPYVYGGASPAGFDCSGYVMFVYAQFGISLPHSVSGQAARGTRISIADAVPGDVVIMSGHDGFYAGNGNIMDAPDTGRSISIRPIWTSDFYIVRLGI
ncbi:C40 family peptidase [Rathayibacter soli]|uniref:C40 family peptidase n=1 Tax=Rathayibacter soli TaxID=3144168 RepID=UPI0027E5058D|nr:C40 family peptidase [Glaciibacter superstes]